MSGRTFVDVRDSQSKADVSVKLPCGLTVRFHQSAKPDGNILIEPMQRAIRTTGNFENLVNEQRERGPFGPLVVVNHMGSWINMAAHAVQIGLREIEVWQNPRTNETLTDTRRYLYAPNEKIVAIPNYKCGYSSLKMVFSQLWVGDAAKESKRQVGLDGIMPISELPAEFIFSIVRDPIERFVSFYVDKFMRPPTHSNFATWRMPHEVLLGKNFSPDSMLWLIENTPTAFADLHWKPFGPNLFHGGRALAHRVYDIDAAATLSQDLSDMLKRRISLPHANVTDHIDHKDVQQKTMQAKDRLERAYAADFDFLAKVKARGGVASPAEIGLLASDTATSLQTVA